MENDLKLVVNKQKQGGNPLLDFINLLRKYDDQNSRWEIMAQMCSYAILFSDYSNSLVGIEQFMVLIKDQEIATSEIITVRNRSKLKLFVYYFFMYIIFNFRRFPSCAQGYTWGVAKRTVAPPL